MRCLELFLHLNHNFLKKAFYAFLLLFFLSSSLEAKITIELSSVVTVKKEDIYLKDISKIESDKKDENFKKFIGSILLEKITEGVIKIDKQDIKKRLEENYIDTKSIVFKGADKTIVKRVILKISQEDIIKDVIDYLKKKFGDSIEILSVSVAKKELKIPDGRVKKRVKIKTKTNSHIYLVYSLFVNDKKIKTIPITVKIHKNILLPLAKRDIPKGKKIGYEDIYFKKMAAKNSSIKNIKAKDIVGKIAKIDIKKDSIIKTYFLSPDFLVLKRKNVKIIYKNGPISIELMGLALENGSLGDIIRVKNISSNKVIRCEVVAPFVVKYLK